MIILLTAAELIEIFFGFIYRNGTSQSNLIVCILTNNEKCTAILYLCFFCVVFSLFGSTSSSTNESEIF